MAYGEGRSIAWLMAHLQVFQERLNVPNKMSVFEIETCAQNIHDSYHHLKTTELMLFFARLLGGAYPVDWHGYVTPTKIISALREHFMPWRNDMLYKLDKQEQERKREEERRNYQPPTPEEQEHIREIQQKLASKFNANPPK